MNCSMPCLPVLYCLLEFAKFISIELLMLSSRLILYNPLLLPSVFLSIRFFPSELTLCIRCPEYWSFHFSISPSNEYSGLSSFRIDWFHLLAVQGTLKSLLLCVYMYVCLHIYSYIYIYIYIYMHTHVYTHIHIHVYYTRTFVCT